MVGEPTSRLQISGYRFLVRRMSHALVRGDVRMLDDPLRAQALSLTAGCVLAVIAIAACAVLAVLAPKGALGSAPIVMVRDSGALYVRIGDTMHPALNLASARLIAGTAATPELVSASAVDRAKRGALVGIPGAPNTLSSPLDAQESNWTVCQDAASTTTLLVGAATEGMDVGRNALVVAGGEGAAATYLLYDGVRARVDLRNPAVVRALQLDGVEPRILSRALLDAVPEVPALTVPAIAHAGAAGPARLHGIAVGTVVRLPQADSTEYYVVLSDGVQRIGAVAADLIRFTYAAGRPDITTVEPGVIGTVPVVDDLPVGRFPQRGGVADDPVLCTLWSWSASAEHAVVVGNSLPRHDADAATTLAQADGAGAGIDRIYLPRGRAAYVRASGVTGAGADTGALYYVDPSGVAFGVHDEDAAKRLGLSGPPVPAPWPVLARLPRGPELSVGAASIVRDTLGSPS
ncbi:type VII secretion protein EccB [Mycolicibacterium holsaticum]|uniref:type VII secretion protein EccB n=1 Tax=Mycolicibacterium holsaticum TaxID=152142 RepID=UPI001C7E1C1F|nr:type VII secretion protein EccB [Mycolicibacterium holsaticum]MDA4109178.1 type VII secretion protein [Mycolicibacterium holsaticum DSM 44478 = JCM 12374]QZA11578.1 type VII secretion protein EccB [Mycolicibacterium holsaticum DSM 44478 = JCM 12374]UNC10933.1 type VII secretion protein EccB [Mycolicibacterium holsaticum DSM 44478 = JCM 12374]